MGRRTGTATAPGVLPTGAPRWHRPERNKGANPVTVWGSGRGPGKGRGEDPNSEAGMSSVRSRNCKKTIVVGAK